MPYSKFNISPQIGDKVRIAKRLGSPLSHADRIEGVIVDCTHVGNHTLWRVKYPCEWGTTSSLHIEADLELMERTQK